MSGELLTWSYPWSPVTESNRRPSPYHVPLDDSRSPSRAPDQHIRWHRLAETSPDQRRRAPFCPSECPSGPAPSGPRHTSHPQIRRPFERACQSTRGSARTQGTSEPRTPGALRRAVSQDDPASQPASRQPTDPQTTGGLIPAWLPGARHRSSPTMSVSGRTVSGRWPNVYWAMTTVDGKDRCRCIRRQVGQVDIQRGGWSLGASPSQ
jgi:hypothetical protein